MALGLSLSGAASGQASANRGQHALQRGISALHEFEYEDANDAFREAQRFDSGLALAYWGEAMTYHQSLWARENLAAASTRPLDWRSDFPAIPAGWAYLDSAATAQKPKPVIEAITRGYAETYATVHRGVYQRSADMTLAFEASRAKQLLLTHRPCELPTPERYELAYDGLELDV